MNLSLRELNDYVKEKANEGLVKIEPTIEVLGDEDESIYVIKVKETYNFLHESEADEAINNASQDKSCVGHDKKFKQGKVNKNGEVSRPDVWSVVLKYQN